MYKALLYGKNDWRVPSAALFVDTYALQYPYDCEGTYHGLRENAEKINGAGADKKSTLFES